MSALMAGLQKLLLSTEQIEKRVDELARQISSDYANTTLHVVCVLENAFVFMADLVRKLSIPVACSFVRPVMREKEGTETPTTEIFFGPQPNVSGEHVLLVEGLVQSGQTTDFLIRTFSASGAASVKVCTLLDKQSDRTISLQPDYFGFIVHEQFVMGYGLGDPRLGRNLPYITSRAGGE